MWVYRVCGRTVAMGNTYFQRDHRENGGINAYGEAVVVLLMPFMVTFSNCSDISWLPDFMGDRWPWSYGSWIYNYLRNQCLSPLRCEFEPGSGEVYSIQHYVMKFVSDLRHGRWFSPGPPVSSTNKTDRHDITEILLKVVLNTIKQTKQQ